MMLLKTYDVSSFFYLQNKFKVCNIILIMRHTLPLCMENAFIIILVYMARPSYGQDTVV